MALARDKLKEYANNMNLIIGKNISKNTDLFSLANKDLMHEGIEGIVCVSTRILRVDGGGQGFLFTYRPSLGYTGPSPLSFDVPFFGDDSRIELECEEMLEGYKLWVKDIEGNFVQRKDFKYSGMDSVFIQLPIGL